jgi:plasmid stabilization system protein ParE
VKPRRFVLTVRAEKDVARRARYLAEVRGDAFAEACTADLLAWLRKLADSGAQLGTSYGEDPRLRAFGYARQATIIARFERSTLRVLAIYFKGQDWRQGTR